MLYLKQHYFWEKILNRNLFSESAPRKFFKSDIIYFIQKINIFVEK